jgi:uncharacterized membrane protein
MGKNRLEAFSDGVLAILITIMVLELKVPHGDTFAALGALLPTFVSYALSFIYLAIYAAAILLSFLNRWIGFGLYWVVALMWLIPDRRIERVISD